MTRNLTELVRAARRVSTPLLAVSTPDQPAALERTLAAANGDAVRLSWDCVRGVRPAAATKEATAAALEALAAAYGAATEEELRATTLSPVAALEGALRLPAGAILVALGAHRWVGEAPVAQAALNLRDPFKATRRTLVLLGPDLVLPAELRHDVVAFSEPLPDDAALRRIITALHEDARLGPPAPDVLAGAAVALRGLSLFEGEQEAAMALREAGLDVDDLRHRQKAAVERVRGLGLTVGGETFDAIGGLDAAKAFGRRLFAGRLRPDLVVRVDEIDKALAGSGYGGPGDSSGVSQDALGVLLQSMEDNRWRGVLAVGPPGSGKTLWSRALGATHGVPTATLDLGALRGSLVGESEQAVREAVKTILALGGERVFWVGTCNRLDSIPPELRRRFRRGIWFFDLPDGEERDAIWRVWLDRLGLGSEAGPRPVDADWTGSDIASCAELAWELDSTLEEAARWVVPVGRADPQGILRLRQAADGRFLSASTPGPYRMPGGTWAAEPLDRAARRLVD